MREAAILEQCGVWTLHTELSGRAVIEAYLAEMRRYVGMVGHTATMVGHTATVEGGVCAFQ